MMVLRNGLKCLGYGCWILNSVPLTEMEWIWCCKCKNKDVVVWIWFRPICVIVKRGVVVNQGLGMI